MINRDQITGIVLAGGTSSRMGTAKGLIDFRGNPLIQYSIDTLRPICSQIIISTNSVEFNEFGYPIQADIIQGAGPLGGIYSSLMNSSTDHNLVLPCDTPYVTSDLLNIILKNSDGYQVVVPLSKPGYLEPLIGYYHKNNVTAMLSFLESDNLKLTDYIESALYKSIPVYKNPEVTPNLFMNINSTEDLNEFGKQEK